jgi:hypothetical protein
MKRLVPRVSQGIALLILSVALASCDGSKLDESVRTTTNASLTFTGSYEDQAFIASFLQDVHMTFEEDAVTWKARCNRLLGMPPSEALSRFSAMTRQDSDIPSRFIARLGAGIQSECLKTVS